MIPDASGKIESGKNDAVELSRVLELELIQKRATWKRASARYRTIRNMGLFFLLILVIGVIAAFLFLFSRLNEQRANQQESAPATENR